MNVTCHHHHHRALTVITLLLPRAQPIKERLIFMQIFRFFFFINYKSKDSIKCDSVDNKHHTALLYKYFNKNTYICSRCRSRKRQCKRVEQTILCNGTISHDTIVTVAQMRNLVSRARKNGSAILCILWKYPRVSISSALNTYNFYSEAIKIIWFL